MKVFMENRHTRLAFQLALLMLLLVPVAPAHVSDKQSLRVNVDLVNIYVTVRNNRGRLISTLGRESFTVLEDNAAQTVTHFSRETDVPLTLALIIDTSGSVYHKLPFEKRATSHFLREVMRRSSDKAALVSFDTFVALQQDYSGDSTLLAKSLMPLVAGGGTCLYDALFSVIRDKLSGPDERKVVVVITDGDDNLSRRSAHDVVELAQRNDVSIFAVSTNRIGLRPGTSDQSDAVSKMLAAQTGGSLFVPVSTDQLASDFNKLANELHSHYTIAYRSTNARRDGSFRRIRIEIPKHTYSVRAPAGYYAPGESGTSSFYPE